MATEFLMPKLGLTMEEGTIAEWLVDDGATVEAGTAVLRIETDKTETDVEASASGCLHPIGTVGETYACGALIGWLVAVGERPPSPQPAAVNVPGDRLLASPNARRIAAERGLDLRQVTGTGPGGRIVSEDLVTATPRSAAPDVVRVASSPGAAAPATAAARHLADLLGVDLGTVPADQREQRITREDVALHVRRRLAAAQTPPVTRERSLPPPQQAPSDIRPFRGIRGTIAARMHDSLGQMAQLTLHMDADIDAVVADRARRDHDGTSPSFTDYVIAAVARALHDHPLLNSQVVDDGVALLPDVHVGFAVAVDEGLIVPVVRDTSGLDLSSLAAETGRLAAAARHASLGYGEVEGATFTVSTLGMYGVDGFTPIVNPPNAAILGVGRLRDDVVIGEDGVAGGVKRITLSLTWDHRVLDGAPAARFCRAIVEGLQRPDLLDQPRLH